MAGQDYPISRPTREHQAQWETFRLRMLSKGVTEAEVDRFDSPIKSGTYFYKNVVLYMVFNKADPGIKWTTDHGWVRGHIPNARYASIKLDFVNNTVTFETMRHGDVVEDPITRKLDGSYLTK